jgi:hypothetical protein
LNKVNDRSSEVDRNGFKKEEKRMTESDRSEEVEIHRMTQDKS